MLRPERSRPAADSKFEEVDVTSWLDEADQIDRVRKLSDPETRQFRLDEAKEKEQEPKSDSGDSTELSVSDSVAEGSDKLSELKTEEEGQEGAGEVARELQGGFGGQFS